MAEYTITITDTEDGKVEVDFNIQPPDTKETPAGVLTQAIYFVIQDLQTSATEENNTDANS